MIWHCPHHLGALTSMGDFLAAACCSATYPIVAGIPDLRVSKAAWVDTESDRQRATELHDQVPAEDVAGSVEFVFARRSTWSRTLVARRTAQVLAAVEKLRKELGGWLKPLASGKTPILDLGCGPGMLLAALGPERPSIGIDVSLEWLVVADRMAKAAGAQVHLAAAHAEALPLASDSVGGVAALDVLEHVSDQAGLIREVNRVLCVGGALALATPNRFSLAAEPHVGIWGVGWLPRAWQEAYVTRRTGLSYAFTKLLSAGEIAGLLRVHSSIDALVQPARVPPSDMTRFDRRRRMLATAYNGLVPHQPFRAAAKQFGAFFQVTGTKHAP